VGSRQAYLTRRLLHLNPVNKKKTNPKREESPGASEPLGEPSDPLRNQTDGGCRSPPASRLRPHHPTPARSLSCGPRTLVRKGTKRAAALMCVPPRDARGEGRSMDAGPTPPSPASRGGRVGPWTRAPHRATDRATWGGKGVLFHKRGKNKSQ